MTLVELMLSSAEETQLLKRAAKYTLPYFQIQRAKMILYASQGLANDQIGASTGSVASTLPPENATGNYVKVVQRIPVRIGIGLNQEGVDAPRHV